MSVTFSKSFIYSQAIFWVFFVIVAIVIVSIQLLEAREREVFQLNVEKYLEKPQNDLPSIGTLPPGDAAIQGKLIVVNLNERKIDVLFNQLPKDLKPHSPEQVKTVLWIACHAETSFLVYTDGSKGIDNACDLTFIDIVNHEYLWRTKVRTLSPEYKHAGTESVAPDPSDSILNYLAQLPHKD